jgi:hypothetical protein
MTKLGKYGRLSQSGGLIPVTELTQSSNPREDKADITNASTLFGDPYGDASDLYGDPEDEEGDVFDEEGDVSDLYGDPDPLATFDLISGDPNSDGYEQGAPKWSKKKKIGGALAGIFTGGLAPAIAAIKRRRKSKLAAKKRLAIEKTQQSLQRQRTLTKNVGKIDRNSPIHFFSLKGAKMNAAPIAPNSAFIADMLKNLLDRQNSDTPFYQETAIGAFAAGTWTATATGVATNRFFTGLILQIGTNLLNASPGTVINITASIPTINGTLTIAADPFLLTYEAGFDVRFLFFPWQLVANKPLAVLGQYRNAAPIVITVTGLPAASAVNLIVPGSLHPWTVAMRSALV